MSTLNNTEMRDLLEEQKVAPNVIEDILRMAELEPEEFKVADERITTDAANIADIFGGGYGVLPTAHKHMMLDNCIRLYTTVTLLLTKARAEVAPAEAKEEVTH